MLTLAPFACITDQADNVYSNICGDWGKLQWYIALTDLDGMNILQAPAGADFTAIQNQYEISVYQMLIPSFIGLVNVGDNNGTEAIWSFAWIPPAPGKYAWPGGACPGGLTVANFDAVWSRLTGAPTTGLAIPSSAIMGRQGVWQCLPQWYAQGVFGSDYNYQEGLLPS